MCPHSGGSRPRAPEKPGRALFSPSSPWTVSQHRDFSEAGLLRGRGVWPAAAASAGRGIECLPHWFLGRPERLAGWLASLPPQSAQACQHFPLVSALFTWPTALWPGPCPALAPVVPVTPAHAFLHPLGHGKAQVSQGSAAGGRRVVASRLCGWGKSLNFSEPYLANYLNGQDHFKPRGGPRAKQVGVQMLRSLWRPLTSQEGETVGPGGPS